MLEVKQSTEERKHIALEGEEKDSLTRLLSSLASFALRPRKQSKDAPVKHCPVHPAGDNQ